MNSIRSHGLFLMLAAALFFCATATEAMACPNCRDSLPNGQQVEGQAAQPNVAKGYAWSIYLMIAVPFTLAAAMGGTAFVLIRKASMK
jgi:hypothetical protein